MVFRAATRRVGLAILTVLCGVGAAAADHGPIVSELQPAIRIPVSPLGFLPPSSFYLTYRLSSASLGFLDDAHLLFTFRKAGLLRRIPGDPPDDDDQEIEAVVLDAATGRVTRQAVWRMHDRAQYLWPLDNGNFLVRVRDNLFLTNSSLQLKPYLRLPAPLRSVQISPDRRWMVVETEDETQRASKPVDSEDLGTGKPVKVAIVPVGSNVAAMVSEARNAVTVPMLGDSLLDTLEGRQSSSWVIRAIPLQGQPRTLMEIKSNCQPTLEPVSETVVLAMGCFGGGDDRPVLAVSDDGRQLWRQTWENKYVWPWFTAAKNGSRFAFESVQVARPMGTFQALYPEDVVAQWVGVYDTDTGKPVLIKKVTPVLTAGQNAALTSDGKRFAVLRDGAIEVYDLPPVGAPTSLSENSRPKKKNK